MNVTSIGSAPPVKPTPTVNPISRAAQPKAPKAGDSAQISTAAQAAAKAAVQEATETKSQTAQEARSGDIQAQRLMARYAAQ